jgi:hypothetical protein
LADLASQKQHLEYYLFVVMLPKKPFKHNNICQGIFDNGYIYLGSLGNAIRIRNNALPYLPMNHGKYSNLVSLAVP